MTRIIVLFDLSAIYLTPNDLTPRLNHGKFQLAIEKRIFCQVLSRKDQRVLMQIQINVIKSSRRWCIVDCSWPKSPIDRKIRHNWVPLYFHDGNLMISLWFINFERFFAIKRCKIWPKSPVHNCAPIFLEANTWPDCIPWFVISRWRHHRRCTWYGNSSGGKPPFPWKRYGKCNFVQYSIFMRKSPILSPIISPYFW